jgi:hypothetical protein
VSDVPRCHCGLKLDPDPLVFCPCIPMDEVPARVEAYARLAAAAGLNGIATAVIEHSCMMTDPPTENELAQVVERFMKYGCLCDLNGCVCTRLSMNASEIFCTPCENGQHEISEEVN